MPTGAMDPRKLAAAKGDVGPVATEVVVAAAEVNGKPYTILRFQTPQGVQFFFLPPAYARVVAEGILVASPDADEVAQMLVRPTAAEIGHLG